MPSGYFTDGFLKMGDSFRAIVEHKDDMVRIKYPINFADMEGSFLAYPGCSNLFAQCARKFNNTDNFFLYCIISSNAKIISKFLFNLELVIIESFLTR